jgi:hypothetical protein
MFALALALVAAALALVADGETVIGCIGLVLAIPVSWLGQVWVIPWGGDAYALAMRDVLYTGAVDSSYADHLRRDRLSNLGKDVAELECDSSQQLSEIHRLVVVRIQEIARLDAGGDGSLAERAVYAHEIRRELVDQLKELEVYPADSYGARLASGVANFLHEATDARRMLHESLTQMSEQLVKIRPPRHWRDQHSRYLEEFCDYVSTLGDYYTALEGGSIDAIRVAAVQVSGQHKVMVRDTESYLRELGKRYTGDRDNCDMPAV